MEELELYPVKTLSFLFFHALNCTKGATALWLLEEKHQQAGQSQLLPQAATAPRSFSSTPLPF